MESNDTLSCARCGISEASFDGSLNIALMGAGDRGIIDTFPEGYIEVSLCESCALHMLKQEPWLLQACKPSLNINYGHTCIDGEIDWTPMPECDRDEDRHGWARVFAVLPRIVGRPGERAPLHTPSGELASYGEFDSREEAEAHAHNLSEAGFPSRTSEMPSGNYRNFYSLVDPAEWSQWWPSYNVKWLREHRIEELRETVLTIVREPRWSVTHPLHLARALSSATLAVFSR